MKIGRLIAACVCAGLCVSASADIFKKHGKFPVGPNPCAIAGADFNGDGRLDIVTADVGTLGDLTGARPANDELSVLMAQPDQTYVRQPVRVGFGPYALEIANMDTSRAPDIVVGCFHATEQRDLVLLRSFGENLFEPKDFKVADENLRYARTRNADNAPLFPTPGLTSIVVRDFNGDGFRDVVGTGWSSDVLVFFAGVAEKYLGESKQIDAPGGPRDVQAYDFNKDGKLDLATTMYSSGEVALWEGDGKGWFEPRARFSSRGQMPHRIRVADVNRDDKADLVVSQCFAEDSIIVFYGEGDFDFSVSQEILLGKSREVLEYEIRDIVVDDFDANGRTDIAAACYGAGQVVVLQNTAAGTGIPQVFHRENYTFEDAKPRALCVGDFNGDGGKDIAVGLWQANAVSLLLGPGTKSGSDKAETKTSEKTAKTAEKAPKAAEKSDKTTAKSKTTEKGETKSSAPKATSKPAKPATPAKKPS